MQCPCSACGQELKIKPALVGKKVKCPKCGEIMLAPAAADEVPLAEEAAPTPIWKTLLPHFLLALILWSTFVIKLNNLDHTALTRWDEVFHAIVARNVAKHPLEPTLVDVPYLPYDMKKWGENHVWLHKPILPFWQIAFSFTVLGVSTFALRLPSAIFATGSTLFTYLIGAEWFDRRTALIAAALQAINPFLVTLVQGYVFADHVDVSLLFWVEVGMYFLSRSLRNGSWRDLLLVGFAQGLAFLSKSYLAGILLGVALTAWLLPICRLSKRTDCQIGPLRILAMLGVTVLTVAPWLTYCMTQYPDEYWQEEMHTWRHLSSNIEGWAAPWDRVVFDYLIGIHGVFYGPTLVAGIMLIGPAFVRKQAGLWLTFAWAFGVVVPHLFAATKTPSATLLALPPLLLLLGHLIAEASRGRMWSLAALTGVLIGSLVFPAAIRNPGYGYPTPRGFGTLMFQNTWVLYQVAGALAFVVIVAIGWLLLRKRVDANSGWRRGLRVVASMFCVGVLIWLTVATVVAAWTVTSRDSNEPGIVEAGEFARDQLPENAVLLCEERKGYEHLMIMFYADRTCYALPWRNVDTIAAEIVAANGIPYIIARRRMPLEVVHRNREGGLVIYRWKATGQK